MRKRLKIEYLGLIFYCMYYFLLLSTTFYNRVPSLNSSIMVPWERCCSGSSTNGSQIVISWFPECDVVVPKAIRYLTHGTQNVGFLNHVAFNLGA